MTTRSCLLFKVDDQLGELLQTLASSHAEEMERMSHSPRSQAALDASHNAAEAGEGLDLSSLSTGNQSCFHAGRC